ncbi:MAG TPA: tetraacyldisaccharide 4'-kinase [Vicinamibacteria bacterium]
MSAWLAPLGGAYAAGAALRRALYGRGLLPRARLRGPVISIGNLGVGGSGKTPVVARTAELLREAGCAVSVLSRGYRGAFAGGALIVSDGARVLADAAAAGDEPVMLARELPGVVVAVGRRRARAGRAVEAAFGPRVHVLDDGFQHLPLRRDLDVLCLSERDLADRPLPAGRLRESPRAARCADLVLISGTGPRTDALRRELGAERCFDLRREAPGFATLHGSAAAAPARPFLLAGIARPERFAEDASRLCPGWTGSWFFPDHHRYRAHELEAVLARARAVGADGVLTTAKDAVRLPADGLDLPVTVLRTRAVIADEERFRERLVEAARRP